VHVLKSVAHSKQLACRASGHRADNISCGLYFAMLWIVLCNERGCPSHLSKKNVLCNTYAPSCVADVARRLLLVTL
jgi:hypothetical protein